MLWLRSDGVERIKISCDTAIGRQQWLALAFACV